MKTTAKEILKTICGYYDLKISDLMSENRKNHLVRARHIYSYICKEFTDEKPDYIGILINRDRTTVLHSFNKISNEISIYRDIENEINEIKERVFENKLIIKDIDLLSLSINYTNSFIQ